MPDRRLRVLAVVRDLQFGGGENRILNLARSIDRGMVDYLVATLHSRDQDADNTFGSMAGDFHRAGIPVMDLRLARPGGRAWPRVLHVIATVCTILRDIVALRRFLIDRKIDLVDLHLNGALLIGLPAAIAARVPVAVTLYHNEPGPRWSPIHIVRRCCLRMASAIFTDSTLRAAELIRFIGKDIPVYVVPNGVRLSPPELSRVDVLARLGIPSDTGLIVGQVSGFAPSKGHEILLAAAKSVLAARPDLFFLCVGYSRGNDKHLQRLQQVAEDLGIANRVRFTPYPGSIADVWSVIDIHVHASVFDSLPNAIIEAMSLAKPSVVTAVGGIPDLIENERTGLLVPAGDPDALCVSVRRLLDEPGLATAIGDAAKRQYLERCTPEATARQIEASFCEIAGRPKAGPAMRALRN